jgi:hypothetical protein
MVRKPPNARPSGRVSVSERSTDVPGEPVVKKGRHRRYEEARAVKHTSAPIQLDDVGFVPQIEPCPECEAPPGEPHASWCLHEDADAEE